MMAKASAQPTEHPAAQGRKASLLRGLACAQTALTALFLFVTPLLLFLGNTEYGYTKTILAYPVVFLLWTLWGVQSALLRRWHLRLPTLWWPGLALIGAGALSMANATSIGIVLQSLGLLTFFFLFYVYLANLARNRQAFNLCLAAMVLSACCASAYGVLQFQGWVPGLPGVKGGGAAMISSLGNKNFLAEFVGLWLVPSLLLLLGARRAWAKVLVFVLATVNFAVFVTANSMGATLGALTGFGLLLVCLAIWREALRALWKQRIWVGLWVFVQALSLFFVAQPDIVRVLVTQRPQPPAVAAAPVTQLQQAALLQNPLDGLTGLLTKLWKAGSGRTREIDWWVAYEMFRAHPVLGIGLGHYKVRFADYKASFLATERSQGYDFNISRAAQAHNDYVQALAEMGLVGMAALLAVLVTLLWKALQQLRRLDAAQKLAVIALYGGAIAFLVDALVNFPAHLAASAFSFIVLLGLAHSGHLNARQRTVSVGGWGLKTALVAVVVVGLSVNVLAYRDWRANVYLDAGLAQLDRGLNLLARESFEKSLALDFQPAEVLFRLGMVNQLLGDVDAAEGYYERSMSSFLVEEVYMPLAIIKLGKGDVSAAQHLLDRLIQSQPPRSDLLREALLLQAVVIMRHQSVEAGITALNAYIDEFGRSPKALFYLGEAQARKGDRQAALTLYREALGSVERAIESERQELANLEGKTVPSAQFVRLRQSFEGNVQLQNDLLKAIQLVSP